MAQLNSKQREGGRAYPKKTSKLAMSAKIDWSSWAASVRVFCGWMLTGEDEGEGGADEAQERGELVAVERGRHYATSRRRWSIDNS